MKDVYEDSFFTIQAMDEKGAKGGHHVYRVAEKRESSGVEGDTPQHWDIHFQKRSIQDAGVTGIRMEHLLVILRDRIRDINRGPHPSIDLKRAYLHVTSTLAALEGYRQNVSSAGETS